MSKANIKMKLASFLLIFGFAFGMGTNVTSSFSNQTQTITAQASTKVSASQAKKIAQINANLSKTQKAAKNWIAYHESRYNYTARNGNCYGRYQLLRAYLHGDYSAVNQEKAANKYVSSRYGTWTHAKSFWQAHHWY